MKNSTLNDTAQINFNYVFSFLCPFFIRSNRLNKAYMIVIIFIFICLLIPMTVDFKDEKQLKQNDKYSNGTYAFLIIIYILIYFFTSLISLMPHKILMKDKNFSCFHIFVINTFLTIGVIIKSTIHYIFEISSIFACSIIFLCSSFLFLILCNTIPYFYRCLKKKMMMIIMY